MQKANRQSRLTQRIVLRGERIRTLGADDLAEVVGGDTESGIAIKRPLAVLPPHL